MWVGDTRILVAKECKVMYIINSKQSLNHQTSTFSKFNIIKSPQNFTSYSMLPARESYYVVRNIVGFHNFVSRSLYLKS